MFTGIVTDTGEIMAMQPAGEGLQRLKIACGYDRRSILDGASIACSGVCLTVVGTGEENGRTWFAADAAAETLNVTTVGSWRPGTKINLERALKHGDELGGHMVSGHVDGLARVLLRDEGSDSARFMLRAPPALSRFIATKGSVTLDGVSLTVNAVQGDDFSVLIIPHTLKVTTLGTWQRGAMVNLEVDMLARYAARLAETR